jgi:hypothetical protein
MRHTGSLPGATRERLDSGVTAGAVSLGRTDRKGNRMSDTTSRPWTVRLHGGHLTRRGLLGGVAGVALASFPGVPSARASSTLSGQRFDLALRVTRAVAQFPIEFPALGEKSPALARASSTRLSGAARRVTTKRLTQVGAAADSLIADGMLRQRPEALVMALGARAARDGEAGALASLIALSVATLAPRNDPNDDGFARTWLGGLARMHQQDTLGDAVTRRGIR